MKKKTAPKVLKTPHIYRPIISDPDRTLRMRMNQLSAKTGMKIQALETKAIETGLARLEEINK